MLLFRIRILLEITSHVPQLHPVHGPLVYALLSSAYGEGLRREPVLPAGLIPIAPEQLRIQLVAGDQYAFGFSLFAATPRAAADTIAPVWRGLEQIGGGRRRYRPGGRPGTLDGNFRIARVEDITGRRALQLGQLPQALDANGVVEEVERVAPLRRITLRFTTPLRCQLPRPLITPERRFMDREVFLPDVFLRRLPQRLAEVGLDATGGPAHLAFEQSRVIENRLVWLDVDYGNARKRGMRLGGAVGSITIELPEGYPPHWLVWGQYTQVGESTRFDHGRYRIAELGPDPYPCGRSADLVDLALRSPGLDVAAEESGADAGTAVEAARAVRAGQYVPPAPRVVWLERPGHKARRLTVSSVTDRALQRAVLSVLAPALDSLFESSSFAYRRGLSRQTAARRIERLYRDGFRWAIQADFDAFFESISQRELADRLAAYLCDARMEALLMSWVRAGDVERDGQGLPTGYPISPLLANLMLDAFDERIRDSGGVLVRYADDFLIFFRDNARAEALFESARQAAEQLRLRLNADKTFLRDLNRPFTFLGFRFEPHEEWRVQSGQPPRRVEEIGWIDVTRERPPEAPRAPLPGESRWLPPAHGPVYIADSDIRWVGVEEGCLKVLSSSGYRRGPRLDQIEQLLVVGSASLDQTLLAALRDTHTAVLMCDTDGRAIGEWIADTGNAQAEVLAAQVRCANDESRRLAISRSLIAAKLDNYAALDQAYPSRTGAAIGAALRTLAESAERAATIAELVGIEGAGAALWYKTFAGRLPTRFSFNGRVAPHATDPVNVLLNVAQTHLYRNAMAAARLIGLSPCIGLLHRPRAGFAPLAADLQEPFRMLMDRAVLDTASQLRLDDFVSDDAGEFPLRLSFVARRRLLATVYESLQTSVLGAGGSEPFTYRHHIVRLARSLRRALLDDRSVLDVLRLGSNNATAVQLTVPAQEKGITAAPELETRTDHEPLSRRL